MDEFIERIKFQHSWKPPDPNVADILNLFEKTHLFRLPNDLVYFYRHYSQATLFDNRFHILPIASLSRISTVICGDDSADWCPPSWYAFCDLRDGNYVGMDLSTVGGNSCNILDCYHEDVPNFRIIATSFSEFFERILTAQGEIYWLQNSFQSYGITAYNHPPSLYRRLFADFWQSLGEEVGPELCAFPQCDRKHIKWSVMCKKHHYEMIQNHKCPFED
jgi:hypothetical protein